MLIFTWHSHTHSHDIFSVYVTKHNNSSHLDFDWPGEVADINVEGNVGIATEIELLVGETILKLLYVAAGDYRDFLTSLSPSCSERQGERKKENQLNTQIIYDVLIMLNMLGVHTCKTGCPCDVEVKIF